MAVTFVTPSLIPKRSFSINFFCVLFFRQLFSLLMGADGHELLALQKSVQGAEIMGVSFICTKNNR
jgi:hypothetical protein